MATETHVKGLAELQKFLDQLAPKMEANVMRGALRAGMNVIKAAAQANVHSVSGKLAAGLKVGTRSSRGTVRARLRASGEHDYIAVMVEYGTRAHFISVQESEKPINLRASVRQGRLVRASMTTINRNSLMIGSRFVGPTVYHPGARPRAFMRPALDSQAPSAVQQAAAYIRERLATKHGLDTSGVVLEGDE